MSKIPASRGPTANCYISGICPSLLGQIERGNKNLSLLTVLLIANGLETTVADLLAGIA